jgi:cysteinyl-tRNA synthetase
MNITDVGHLTSDSDTGEDKMSVAAKRENKSVLEIAKMYTDIFFKEMKMLNIKMPEIVSNATDNIDQYVKITKKLLETGYAYKAGDNIYFDVSKFPAYYDLSRKKADDLQVGAREDVEFDNMKRNQADFVLWFNSSKFENHALKWETELGTGYPGWHIECSGISLKYLGEYLDIHCGAVDAIFPHHTNEIAQSEAYLGHKWCNYWVHLAFLNDETGKMSKSNGEFLTISNLEKRGFDPLVYRFYCLQSHYRNTLTFDFEKLEAAQNTYNKLVNKLDTLKANYNEKDINQDTYDNYINKFKEALSNDLNTASTITLIHDLLKDNCSDSTKIALIKQFDTVLSLDLLNKKETKVDENLEIYINEMIEKRNIAKKNKDFALADQIRDELKEKGILIKDTREGTIYEIIK